MLGDFLHIMHLKAFEQIVITLTAKVDYLGSQQGPCSKFSTGGLKVNT